METLKILLVNNDSRFGGSQIALGNMAYALSRRGHEVHILLGAENIPERLVKLCSQRCRIHKTTGYSSLAEFKNNVQKLRNSILNLHESFKFDVINAFGITGMAIPALLQNQLVVTLHGNNVQRGLNLLIFSSESPEMWRSIPRAPGNFSKNVVGHFLYGQLERIACKKSKLVVTLTKQETYYARKNYSLTSEKIRVVPNAIVGPEANDSESQIPHDGKVVLSVGALEFIKGIPILAKTIKYILSTIEDAMYISVGNGPLMSYIQKLKAEFPNRVVVVPSASTTLASIYACSSVFVQASLYEAFSLSMAEAMLAQKPIVAFNLASIPELVVDKESGRLAKPVCSKDLASKTISLLEDEKTSRSLGVKAKKIVDTLYNFDCVGRSMETVLKEV